MSLQYLPNVPQPCDPKEGVLRYLASASTNDNLGEALDSFNTTSTLCAQLISHFKLVLNRVETQPNGKGISISLERSYSRLKLWSDDYGIAVGNLDGLFGFSRSIRRATQKLLLEIGSILTERKCDCCPLQTDYTKGEGAVNSITNL